MLVRYENHPGSFPLFDEMFSLDRQIGKIFGQSFLPAAVRNDLFVPRMEVSEGKDDIVVTAELPGVSKDDLKITVEDGVLTVKGEKKQEKESKERDYHRVERSYGSFERSFTLPTAVNAEKIDASFKDGVLEITLPKAEEAKPKQIDVKVK